MEKKASPSSVPTLDQRKAALVKELNWLFLRPGISEAEKDQALLKLQESIDILK